MNTFDDLKTARAGFFDSLFSLGKQVGDLPEYHSLFDATIHLMHSTELHLMYTQVNLLEATSFYHKLEEERRGSEATRTSG